MTGAMRALKRPTRRSDPGSLDFGTRTFLLLSEYMKPGGHLVLNRLPGEITQSQYKIDNIGPE